MTRRTALAVVLILAAATGVRAQTIGEFSANGGYTVSDGFSVTPVVIGGKAYDQIEPKSGGSYGFTAGLLLPNALGVEFRWSHQISQLLATTGSSELAIAHMGVDNYHGTVVYHWTTAGGVIPFLFVGFGATHYAPGTLNASAVPAAASAAAAGAELQGTSRFSTVWGGGLEAYGQHNIGVRVAATWTPTYIRSDAAGIWCSPIYCWVVGNASYSSQVEISAGMTLRLGR